MFRRKYRFGQSVPRSVGFFLSALRPTAPQTAARPGHSCLHGNAPARTFLTQAFHVAANTGGEFLRRFWMSRNPITGSPALPATKLLDPRREISNRVRRCSNACLVRTAVGATPCNLPPSSARSGFGGAGDVMVSQGPRDEGEHDQVIRGKGVRRVVPSVDGSTVSGTLGRGDMAHLSPKRRLPPRPNEGVKGQGFKNTHCKADVGRLNRLRW
jgi:hypothetical protein